MLVPLDSTADGQQHADVEVLHRPPRAGTGRVTSPFDPRWWVTGVGVRGPEPGGGQRPVAVNWLDTWTDLTTWWIEPAVSVAESWRVRHDQLLAQLVGGIASRFGGRPVDVEVRGHRVRAILDSLSLLPRRAGSYELRVDATDAVVEGLQVDRVDAVVRSVRLEPGRNPKLVGTGVEVTGAATLSSLVEWIDDRVSGWSLTVDGDGNVLAQHDRSDVKLVVEPWVRDGALHLEARMVRWRRLRARVPRWLRLERVHRLEIGPGWTLAEADRTGDGVRFRFTGDVITHELHLPDIREAILRGTRLVS